MKRVAVFLLCASLAFLATGSFAAAQRAHNGHRHHKRHHRHRRHHKKHHPQQQQQTQGTQASAGLNVPLDQLLAPESACPGQSDPTLPNASQQAVMVCMINYARTVAGRPALGEIAQLDTSAIDKATDIIACNDFDHSACGHDFTYWFQQVGYLSTNTNTCWTAGENIAWGTGTLGTVSSIANAWIYSPEHLSNILSANFDQVGAGLQVGPLSGNANAHVWVTHFGSHC